MFCFPVERKRVYIYVIARSDLSVSRRLNLVITRRTRARTYGVPTRSHVHEKLGTQLSASTLDHGVQQHGAVTIWSRSRRGHDQLGACR